MKNLLDNSDLNDLQLNEQSRLFLGQIAKWCKFLGIMGFIGVGLMVILAFSMGSLMNSSIGSAAYGGMGMIGSGFLTAIYLIMAIVYFFPVYYLYKFSVNLKQSLFTNNNQELTDAFKYLKSHFMFIGILVIIMLAIYALIFLIALIGGAAAFL